jgi:HSP20 family protein
MHAVVIPAEAGEFGDDIRRIFLELGRSFGLDALTGECSPPLDVFENDEAVEISMDLPGVEPDAVRIVVKNNAVLIVGEKPSLRGRGDSSFHLVERGFGRFARSVRLTTAVNAAKARATLERGELRITLPKIVDTRGRRIEIPITRT